MQHYHVQLLAKVLPQDADNTIGYVQYPNCGVWMLKYVCRSLHQKRQICAIHFTTVQFKNQGHPTCQRDVRTFGSDRTPPPPYDIIIEYRSRMHMSRAEYFRWSRYRWSRFASDVIAYVSRCCLWIQYTVVLFGLSFYSKVRVLCLTFFKYMQMLNPLPDVSDCDLFDCDNFCSCWLSFLLNL